jgi:predicted dehydrogenase
MGCSFMRFPIPDPRVLPEAVVRQAPSDPDSPGIAIVGAGDIVATAHLPAYRRLGLRVLWIFDTDAARRDGLASSWGVAAAESLATALDDPRVEIVDIAVPPRAQFAACQAALAAGKHVLAQKPLARSLTRARLLVQAADRAERWLVVNQQMRWSPIVDAIARSRGDGGLGAIRRLILDLDLSSPRELGWLADEPRYVALFNTIHLVDSARYLCGEVRAVTCHMGRSLQDLHLRGEDTVIAILDHVSGATTEIVDRRNITDDLHARFRVEGSDGALRGTFGTWLQYPYGADLVESHQPGGWQPVTVRGRWFPDAFAGPMVELLTALSGGPPPSSSGRDHLATLAVIEAMYASAHDARRVEVRRSKRAAPPGA